MIIMLLAGCEAASPSPGLDALLQIPGAQYRPGPFPMPSGGPPTAAASLRDSHTERGVVGEKLDGVLAATAHAAIIGLDGADGAWIVPAGAPDTDTPDKASVHVVFGLTEAVPPGPFTILVASSDADGKIGEPVAVEGMATATRWPAGTLVVGLEWTGRADLDLHVVDALGGEAWSDDPNTWVPPPPGVPVDPTAFLAGGILDHDGNARCAVRDGAPNEHVAWSMPA
ncbi:MAG: hypothetical protein NT062_09465, partial [Proteobacteria bacterium]|nr:hypothetical protein [Pseudomonadota bacterium]